MRLADALLIVGAWAFALAGALLALLMGGVLAIADKPTDPARYAREVGVAVAVLVLGLLVAVGGAWFALRRLRRARAGAGKTL